MILKNSLMLKQKVVQQKDKRHNSDCFNYFGHQLVEQDQICTLSFIFVEKTNCMILRKKQFLFDQV
jgi:hypothetical protein